MDPIEAITDTHDDFMLGHTNKEELRGQLENLFEDLSEEMSKEDIKKIIMTLELEDEFNDVAYKVLKKV